MIYLRFITLKDLAVGGDLLKRQTETHTLHGSANGDISNIYPQEGKPLLGASCQSPEQCI